MDEELKQIAIKAKEFGFKSRTITTIYTEKFLFGGKNTLINNMCFYLYLCDLQEWLREKHNIEVIVFPIKNKENVLFYTFENLSMYVNSMKTLQGIFKADFYAYYTFNTYQKALQEGIKESLKLIKI